MQNHSTKGSSKFNDWRIVMQMQRTHTTIAYITENITNVIEKHQF